MRSLLSLTLLACAGLLALSLLPASVSAGEAAVASERVQAVLRLDREFAAARAEDAGAEAPEVEANESARAPLGLVPSNLAYSYAVASKLFWHSVSAYCLDNPALHQWSCASCKQFGPFTVTQVMDDTTNQGYVGYFTQGLPASPIPASYVQASDPFVLVSFRGTVSTLADWIEDLSFAKQSPFSTAYPDVKVHGGFWGAYRDLKADMVKGIDSALKASKASTIIVTGHSLGGAMAELAALDLKLTTYPSLNFAVYTQGCPRVGNAAWSSLFAASVNASFREVHASDVVPHLPPQLLGFSHARTEIWFDEAFTHYSYCNSTSNGEDPHCSDSVKLPISVSDHVTYRGVEMGQYCGSHAALTSEQRASLRAAEQAQPQLVDARDLARRVEREAAQAAQVAQSQSQPQPQAAPKAAPKLKRVLTEV